MKRKRGHKKGKKAKANTALVVPNEAAADVVSVNTEDNSVDDEYESGMEVDTPSSTRTDPAAFNVATVNPDSSMDKPIGNSVGRVKVKLKTSSKVLESAVPSHSDNDKSSLQVGFERQCGVYEKMEDTGNSSAEIKMGVSSGGVSRKAGSIKIKSSRMLAASNADKSGNGIGAEHERSYQKESKMPRLGSRFNKQELDSALTVIKKVMKMEAAAPFNEPVNPVALGIPDYFDIIDTPMDFGTICNNLENGDKYMDSEDVFKDVQYIWDNCSRYNNKGDAILDIMRRVKKNFMKYWTGAGLYTEQSQGAEDGDIEDGALSIQGKIQIKGDQSKMKKKHGRRHKSDCLCAICVLKRRKREREANARMAKGLSGVQDPQQEESSPVGTPYDNDSSQNMDESVDPYADAEVEGKGEKVKREVSEHQYGHMEERHEEEEDDEEEEEEDDEEENEIKTINKDEGEIKEQSEFRERLSEERSRKSQPETVDKSGAVALNQKGSTPAQNEEESKAVQQQRYKESQEREHRSKMLESFRFENPTLLNLCGILFPDNEKSVWSGPHSLFQNRGSRTSAIHAAIETFMK